MNGLKESREQTGLTQVDLAVAAGVSPSTIYRLEAGKGTPTPAVKAAIDRALSRFIPAHSEDRNGHAEVPVEVPEDTKSAPTVATVVGRS